MERFATTGRGVSDTCLQKSAARSYYWPGIVGRDACLFRRRLAVATRFKRLTVCDDQNLSFRRWPT